MAEIFNLRTARKAQARAKARAEAATNAAKFGRSKTEKALEATEAARAARQLDAHKRETE